MKGLPYSYLKIKRAKCTEIWAILNIRETQKVDVIFLQRKFGSTKVQYSSGKMRAFLSNVLAQNSALKSLITLNLAYENLKEYYLITGILGFKIIIIQSFVCIISRDLKM